MVACKTFHKVEDRVRIDPKQELQNLQILQNSMSKHAHIRFHIATIVRGKEYIILLPWAKHLDLEIFLREGHKYNAETQTNREVYNFSSAFPLLRQGRFIGDVYVQMANLAQALRWLHEGITNVGMRREVVQVAHMDLKPDNILIDSVDGGVPSSVGTWLLTDFGVSAIKKSSTTEHRPVLSIFEVYKTLQISNSKDATIGTYPRRPPGAYQPPEAEHFDPTTSQAAISPVKVIGRKGDVWSFGAIFAEVVAFSVGRQRAVEDFRAYRVSTKRKNDYFYGSEKIQSDNLGGKSKTHHKPRPELFQWLRGLPTRTTTSIPDNVIECSVRIIERTLVIDSTHRVDAAELVRLMGHLETLLVPSGSTLKEEAPVVQTGTVPPDGPSTLPVLPWRPRIPSIAVNNSVPLADSIEWNQDSSSRTPWRNDSVAGPSISDTLDPIATASIPAHTTSAAPAPTPTPIPVPRASPVPRVTHPTRSMLTTGPEE